jgi:hypothetical protein
MTGSVAIPFGLSVFPGKACLSIALLWIHSQRLPPINRCTQSYTEDTRGPDHLLVNASDLKPIDRLLKHQHAIRITSRRHTRESLLIAETDDY